MIMKIIEHCNCDNKNLIRLLDDGTLVCPVCLTKVELRLI